MVYLEWFRFPDAGQEWSFFMDKPELKRTCYDSYYPFQVLAGRLERLEFEPITILYGGNGSGKTTALNVMAAALGLERDRPCAGMDRPRAGCPGPAGPSPATMCSTICWTCAP